MQQQLRPLSGLDGLVSHPYHRSSQRVNNFSPWVLYRWWWPRCWAFPRPVWATGYASQPEGSWTGSCSSDKAAKVSPEQMEIARLRAEVSRLRMERDIAKMQRRTLLRTRCEARLCLPGPPGATASGRARLLLVLAFLPRTLALLYGGGAQNRGLRAGVCGQAQFLPHGRGRTTAPRGWWPQGMPIKGEGTCCPNWATACCPIGVGSQNLYLFGQPLRFYFRAEAPRGTQKAGARHRAVGIFGYQNKVLVFNHFIVPWVGRCFDSIIDAGTKLTCTSGSSVQASVFA